MIVEYDDGIFGPLEGEDRDMVFAVGRQLRELRREAAVLVWAPRAERGPKALLRTADKVVWYYDERPAAPLFRSRRWRSVQATLAVALRWWAGTRVVIVYAPVTDDAQRKVTDQADRAIWRVPEAPDRGRSVLQTVEERRGRRFDTIMTMAVMNSFQRGSCHVRSLF